MKFHTASLFILLAALAALAGCAPKPTVVPERPRVLSQEEWISALRERTAAWNSYQAQLHIRAESKKGKFNFRAIVVAALPDRYRLEAFNPFGQTVGLLTLNPEQSSLLVPSEKVLYSASHPETLVAHFLGVPIPLETFGYALLGSVPPTQLAHLRVAPHNADWIGHSNGAGFSFTWKFLPQPLSLASINVKEGSRSYTISYDPPVALDPRSIPGTIKFQSAQWRMQVTLDQARSASGLQDSAFRPTLSEGIRKVDLDRVP